MNVGAGDFLLPVDKPVGPTSHDVVAAARRGLGTRRVGHTGTLDPFASGLLVLCVGRATRLAEYLSGMDKTYEAVARLGVTTDTLDREGEVVLEREGWAELDEPQVVEALARLSGEIEQVPPQFSAKKVDGEAMHRRARRGEHVALPPVEVTIHEIALTEMRLPDVRFTVRCSSGTYVRALARDLGEDLGVGAHLTALRRTAVGGFSANDAVTVDELEDSEAVARATIAPTGALGHMGSMEVDEGVAARLRNGQRVRVDEATDPEGEVDDESRVTPTLVAVSHDHDLLAIAELDDGLLRPRKVFPS